MRILVVCGAGASSTFVAQRVRHAAHARGLDITATAGTEQSLPIDLDAADVVLVGPQLTPKLDRINEAAAARGTRVILLPVDIFSDLDGTRTLALVTADPASSSPRSSISTTPSTERTLP